MNKKFISAALAALMMVSTAAVAASADEVKTEAAGAPVAVEASGDAGTFQFDPGDWASSKICFYIWDESTTPTTYASKDGWIEDNTWGSKKKTGGTKLDDGKFESFEIDFSGRENDDIFVIFFDPDTSAQTFDCVLNASAIGDVAVRTGEICENPVDSEKTAEAVLFQNSGLTSKLCITSSGKVQGTTITPTMNRPFEVAKFVFKYQGTQEKISHADVVTEETVSNAITAFETTPDEVWAEYLKLKDNPDYAETYTAEKEAEAKKFIKPTDNSGSDDTSSKEKDDDDTSSNTSSKAASTASTASTASKAATTTTGTTATTAATASTEAAASTGDTTNTAAFAIILVCAAAAMVLARRKVEE